MSILSCCGVIVALGRLIFSGRAIYIWISPVTTPNQTKQGPCLAPVTHCRVCARMLSKRLCFSYTEMHGPGFHGTLWVDVKKNAEWVLWRNQFCQAQIFWVSRLDVIGAVTDAEDCDSCSHQSSQSKAQCGRETDTRQPKGWEETHSSHTRFNPWCHQGRICHILPPCEITSGNAAYSFQQPRPQSQINTTR